MRTYMPFDTEKERKPLKILEMGISWRQGSYLAVCFVIFIQLVQYTYSDSFPLPVMVLIWLMDALIFVPALIFGFYRNQNSGLFLDKHMIYYMRHKKRESGLWRRF